MIPNRIGVVGFERCGPWVRSHGPKRTGHLTPAKVLKRTNRLLLDFMATENRHAILARIRSESPSIVGLMQFPVPIQIESGIDPCVDRPSKEVLPWRLLGWLLAILPLLARKVSVQEHFGRTLVVVDFVQQKHIGRNGSQDLSDFRGLWIPLLQSLGQLASRLAIHRSIERRDAQDHGPSDGGLGTGNLSSSLWAHH